MHKMVGNRLGTGHEPDHSGKTSASMLAIFSPTNARRAMRLSASSA